MPFIGKFDAVKIGPRLFKLNKPISYIGKDGKKWTAPAGFITDGASIPFFAWPIIGSPFTGKYTLPSVIHDYHYKYLDVSRVYADRGFLEGMKEREVSWWKRRTMWGFVRSCSWVIWNRRKKANRR